MPTRRHEFAMDAPAAGVEDLTRYHGWSLQPAANFGAGVDGMFDNGAECVAESGSVG